MTIPQELNPGDLLVIAWLVYDGESYTRSTVMGVYAGITFDPYSSEGNTFGLSAASDELLLKYFTPEQLEKKKQSCVYILRNDFWMPTSSILSIARNIPIV